MKNIGTKYSGRETVQLYVEGPQGKMGRPVRELVGFAKTHSLNCSEEERLQFKIPVYRIASYDDSGVSGYSNAYVLESGKYHFYVGTNVRDTEEVPVDGKDGWLLKDTLLIEQCEEALAPIENF